MQRTTGHKLAILATPTAWDQQQHAWTVKSGPHGKFKYVPTKVKAGWHQQDFQPLKSSLVAFGAKHHEWTSLAYDKA